MISGLIIGSIIGLCFGGLIVWLWLSGQLHSTEKISAELRNQVQEKDNNIQKLNSELMAISGLKMQAETRLEGERKNLKEQQELLSEAEQKMKETFDSLSLQALKDNSKTFLDLANKTLQNLLTEAKGDLTLKEKAIDGLIKPLKESLDKYETQVREMERERGKAYGELKNQLEQLGKTEESLQKETDNLVRALKTPQVRGRWGEMALKRVVEIAGMTKYCDFDEQISVDTEEGRKRPDLLVKLPLGRMVVVDAKVSLTAYMEALNAPDEAMRQVALKRHAEAVKTHMKSLCSKTYWEQFKPTPEFVVLFIPGESFFSAAVEQDHGLIEESAVNRVILASPTTLIALLKAVAYGWRQEQIAENAQLIAQTGKELFERICKFTEHLVKIREGIITAGRYYNEAVGSLESRLIPSARKLKELGAAAPEKELSDLTPTDTYLREPQSLPNTTNLE